MGKSGQGIYPSALGGSQEKRKRTRKRKEKLQQLEAQMCWDSNPSHTQSSHLACPIMMRTIRKVIFIILKHAVSVHCMVVTGCRRLSADPHTQDAAIATRRLFCDLFDVGLSVPISGHIRFFIGGLPMQINTMEAPVLLAGFRSVVC